MNRMTTLEKIKEQYESQRLVAGSADDSMLAPIEEQAYDSFNKLGIPSSKHEEWKYTRIASVFNKDFSFTAETRFSIDDINAVRLPGHEEANELVFINGVYIDAYSTIRSSSIQVMSLQEAAAGEHADTVSKNLGHSGKYIRDGIHALNSAFIQQGVFVVIRKGAIVDHPIYIYNITDARSANILSQPRMLVVASENSQVQLVETYVTLGNDESFTNQVLEIVVEKDARVEYYKIQNDRSGNSQVSTTHFRQTGRSYVHAVTITLNGGIVRNNLNIAMAAEHSEAHLYGLYFLRGNTHADNHTVVDNIQPHCLSNELYKGIVGDHATAVFNGKIFVQPLAQKTNAFQSNKNILLSDEATVNTKPQLEIFADDVKCSHGCTVGQLDEEGLFYLRSRGISEARAKSLLIHAFAIDIIEHIKPVQIRNYVDQLISGRLEL
jgi:Fe-S cluster assembly protein SufD